MKDLIQRARKLARLADAATPGPWRAEPERDKAGFPTGGWTVVASSDWPIPICELWADEESAQLIAAAPEMARLLLELAEALEQIRQEKQGKGICSSETAAEPNDLIQQVRKIVHLMAEAAKVAPLPWEVYEDHTVRAAGGRIIGDLSVDYASRDRYVLELLAALPELVELLDKLADSGSCRGTLPEGC